MNRAYQEKIVIHKDYAYAGKFIREIPKNFHKNGTTIYKGRNILKLLIVDKYLKINVKSFKIPHLINQVAYATIRDSKAKRSYLYAKKLIELGVNTPQPIAYIEFTKALLFKSSYYISEHIEVDNEMRVLQKGSTEEHKELIIQFAKYTANLHGLNVLHLDYSSGNILYKNDGGAYSFYLVDLNRMIFDKEITLDEAAKSLRRLWGSNEMFELFAQEYSSTRGLDYNEFVKLVFHYRNKFWKVFKRKYPDATPYLGH